MNRTQRRAAERLANKAAARQAASTLAADAVSQVVPPAPTQPVLVLRAPSSASIVDAPTPSASRPTEISAARLASNRENALKSTGPRTEQGKAISSQNHVNHGLARKNGSFHVLDTEDQTEYAMSLLGFMDEYQPETPTEVALVHSLAESLWLKNRAHAFQASCFDAGTGALNNEKTLLLFLRYETTHSRAFNSALNQLLKLREEKRKAQIGFEAQKRAAEKHQLEMVKKQAAIEHQIASNVHQKITAKQQNIGFEPQFVAELEKTYLKRGLSNIAAA